MSIDTFKVKSYPSTITRPAVEFLPVVNVYGDFTSPFVNVAQVWFRFVENLVWSCFNASPHKLDGNSAACNIARTFSRSVRLSRSRNSVMLGSMVNWEAASNAFPGKVFIERMIFVFTAVI
ncbi:hypothetical protein MVEN_00913400 [Mycena venus]|uniref:Uncharacterized protein n=1 Tax=Mycena venus TaxID=2733690 RepID=A0A8H6YCL8_9AGAR|nr:hypothetical protein MVEN_00913400 [Mycena venus]